MIEDFYTYDITIYRKTPTVLDGIPVDNLSVHLNIKGHFEVRKIDYKILNDKKTTKVTHRLICGIYDITDNDIAEINNKKYEIISVNPKVNKLMDIDLLEIV